MREPVVRPELEEYAAAHSTPEPEWLAGIGLRTRALGAKSGMMSGPLQGQFLKTIAWMLEARRVLEIGTFTGYSALSMIQGMPEGGRILTCEADPEHIDIARRNIAMSPYAGRIDVADGPALETIREVQGPFDLVFIDADKENYTAYYEAVLPMLVANGLIVADNTLWYSQVIDEGNQEPDTLAIRAFNDHVRRDERVECVILPVRDGVTLIRKR